MPKFEKIEETVKNHQKLTYVLEDLKRKYEKKPLEGVLMLPPDFKKDEVKRVRRIRNGRRSSVVHVNVENKTNLLYKKNENISIMNQNAMNNNGVSKTTKKPKLRHPSFRRGSLPTIITNAQQSLSIDINTCTAFRPAQKDTVKHHDIGTSTALFVLDTTNLNETDPTQQAASPNHKKETNKEIPPNMLSFCCCN